MLKSERREGESLGWKKAHLIWPHPQSRYYTHTHTRTIQFKFICIPLFTIHIVSKQLYRTCISEMYI